MDCERSLAAYAWVVLQVSTWRFLLSILIYFLIGHYSISYVFPFLLTNLKCYAQSEVADVKAATIKSVSEQCDVSVLRDLFEAMTRSLPAEEVRASRESCVRARLLV